MSEQVVTVGKGLRQASRGTIACEFSSRLDAQVLLIEGAEGSLQVILEGSRILCRVQTPSRDSTLDAEDSGPLCDGAWHSLVVVVDERGTRLFVDGYQAFAGTSTAFLSDLGEPTLARFGSDNVTVREARIDTGVWTSTEVLAAALEPEPAVHFAAHQLSSEDVEALIDASSGSIRARFRVRGEGQGGTLMAAAGAGREQLRIRVDADQIAFEVVGRRGQWRRFPARGSWADGVWHDLVVVVARGAVDLYVDGFRVAHVPGGGFLADVADLDTIVVGQNTTGSRFWGEASHAAIYDRPLSDPQVKRLASVAPLDTVALFDRGHGGAASYRIPSLVVSPNGVLIAGADQRTGSPNDSPNHINFVIRRSEDSGATWGELQTVIASYGQGPTGASVIDSCPVVDGLAGRVVVVIDHFPGGIGQPNNEVGSGLTDTGELVLHDSEGTEFVLGADGQVRDGEGRGTGIEVDAQGTIRGEDGAERGNIHADTGPLLTARTCYLMVTWSDDDGQTWTLPRHINHQVKAEWMQFCGTGPGTGIQLRHGPHAGRLLVPIYYEGDHPKRVSSAVIYSDDHGVTWQRGASPNDGRVLADGERIDSRTHDRDDASLHEATIVERSDGSILMLMRNQHPAGRVMASTSEDAGQSWGPVEIVDEITEIFCQPNVIAWASDPRGSDSMVFANASQMMPYRGNGVLRLSRDGGRTWPWSRTINPGHHVYQSMAVLPDGDLGLLWENEWQGLYFTRIPASWFEA